MVAEVERAALMSAGVRVRVIRDLKWCPDPPIMEGDEGTIVGDALWGGPVWKTVELDGRKRLDGSNQKINIHSGLLERSPSAN